MPTAAPDESLVSRTYRALRRQIILGRLPQGGRLVESALAEELGVSRLPIREALPILENEGFIHTLPRRGSRTAVWTSADVIELYDARVSLEGLAARLAAEAAGAGASTADLASAIAHEQNAISDGDWLAAAEASTLVHGAIVDLGGSTLLRSLMRGIAGRMTWLSFLTAGHDRGHQSEAHEDVVDAILTGNARLAEAVMVAHVEQGRAPSLRVIDSPVRM